MVKRDPDWYVDVGPGQKGGTDCTGCLSKVASPRVTGRGSVRRGCGYDEHVESKVWDWYVLSSWHANLIPTMV